MTLPTDSLKMLVVDDDDVDRERVRRFLSRSTLAVDVTEAESGSQALQLIRRQAFDCIVLDNHLGDTTGAELIELIQKEERVACPIIMVTGAGSETLAVQAMQGGAYDYLPKTQLSADVLHRSVHRAVELYKVQQQLKQIHDSLEQRVDQQAATIRQREKDLRALVDNSPMAMAYWDRDLRCRFGNLSWSHWFRTANHDLKGQQLSDVLGGIHYADVASYVAEALGGVPQAFEQKLQRDEQPGVRWVYWQLRPDLTDDGQCLGFYSTVSDITDSRAAQDRIVELLHFSAAVIDNSPIGIAVFQSDGACALSNQSFLDMCGERQDWTTTALWPHVQTTLEEGQPCRVDVLLSSGAEPTLHLECALARFDRAGSHHILVIARDVTEQIRDHAALVSARDSAESAARTKSAFLANMSHEIRTPMNAIVGFSRLVLEDELPRSTRGYLEKLHTSALALMDILDDVLDYSKIEAGFMHLEHARFVLEESLQRVVDLFQARMEQKRLQFTIDIAPDVPRVVLGDPLRLSQILTNLVGNAVKFTDSGFIHLKITANRLSDADTSTLLQFVVSDSGVGVAPDMQAGLFEAFIQGDSSITRRFGGTGLGLAICKRLAHLMGGEIGVRSRPGHGSEFWFTICVDALVEYPTLDGAADIAGRRALVIDPNALASRSLQRQLRAWHVVPHAGEDLAAGMAQLERLRRKGLAVDTLVIDGALIKQADALALTQLLEAASLAAARPVMFFVTATHGERLEMRGVLDLPEPHAVLSKPVLASRLLEAFHATQRHEIGDAQGKARWRADSDHLRTMASPLRGAKVLLVEDNELNQIVADEFLRRCNMHVTVVGNGLQAVEMLQGATSDGFDVVLMDMHMPVMDGLEATRRIMNMPHVKHLPVIGMTAAVLPEDRQRCQEVGMVDHIAKPVIPEHLIAVLLKWVAKQSVVIEPTAPSTALLPFDLDALRERVHGNDELVKKLLSAFVQQESTAVDVLQQMLDGGDHVAAMRKAHDLKGSAANLGLMVFSSASARLQEALSSSKSVETEMALFKQAHLECMQIIRHVLSQTKN